MLYYIVLAVGVVVSFIFCYQRRLGFSIKNLIFKSVSSLCYLLTAVFALIHNSSAYTYGSLIIMGGALGLVGDILLDLKGVYKKDEKVYLKGGFIFFLVGHIFYIAAIIYSLNIKWWLVLISSVVSAVIGYLTVASANLMKVHYGAYRKIVAVYVAFLAMTTVLSVVAVFVSSFEKGYILMAVGSVLFLLSDAVLSNTFFGRGKDKPVHLFINHFLYYAGQYLIAASIMFMK
ncbi:MAG: lysoplasmalogenase [Bacteroides sp.]|nr:lysoplasmalogenase [Bacteroides sp.]MCM1434396.1 lysoplasmalogenase [Clostridiales bacterium]